ncbi:MAG: hypothetical protein M5U35_05350 [Roseovarius sp.]|nr:hypothetical protein [Roseovarius sp.]
MTQANTKTARNKAKTPKRPAGKVLSNIPDTKPACKTKIVLVRAMLAGPCVIASPTG